MVLLSNNHALVFAVCETGRRELGCGVGLGIARQNPTDAVELAGYLRVVFRGIPLAVAAAAQRSVR